MQNAYYECNLVSGSVTGKGWLFQVCAAFCNTRDRLSVHLLFNMHFTK